MKLKTTAWIAFVISIASIVVALYLNFDLIPNIRYYSDLHQENMENIESEFFLIEYIMQLQEVNGQVIELDPSKNRVVGHLDIIIQSGSLFISDLNDMNEISLNRHITLTKSMQDDLEQLIAVSKAVKNNIIDNQLSGVEVIGDIVNNVQDNFSVLNTRIINDIQILLNLTFSLIIVTIGIMFVALFRLVTYTIPFVDQSLQILLNSDIHHNGLPEFTPFFEEEGKIQRSIQKEYKEKTFSTKVHETLFDLYTVEDAMDVLFGLLSDEMNVDRIGLAFVDYQKREFVAEYGVIREGEIKLGPGFIRSFDQTSLTRMLSTKSPKITADLELDFNSKPSSSSLQLLINENIKSNLAIPMIINDSVFGVLFLSSFKKNFFNEQDILIGNKIVNEAKALLNRAYFTNVVLIKVATAFSELVEKKDNETGEHINRMVRYSVLLSRALQHKNNPSYVVSERMILDVERNAALHDIGKIAIPDYVLKKDGGFTEEEWEIMKTHPTIGADVFKNLHDSLKTFDQNFYSVAEEISRYHHEKWNGSGYPEGLSGFDIPLSARIIAVSDVFDAISTKRVYKEAFSFDKSVAIIQESAGVHLDPFIVEVFLEEIDEIKVIYDTYR